MDFRHSTVHVGSFLVLLEVLLLLDVSDAISQRKIYTLFTTPKTWNEAHDICDNQLGTLIKIRGEREIAELISLDTYEWNSKLSTILSGSGFWSGLHRPFSSTNDTWEYQDCENLVATLTFTNPSPISNKQHCGAFIGANYDLYEAPCNEKRPFICQRFNGDCWYEPFPEYVPNAVLPGDIIPLTETAASDCAMKCRDEGPIPECWALMYDPTDTTAPCKLITKSGNTASSYYVDPNTRTNAGLVDMIFYVRRCFEGVKDNNAYGSFVDTKLTPNSFCSTHIYAGEPQALEVCFCSTQEHPPIPPPLSSEAMAEQYASELVIDTGNTSSAQRKLSSAEDNRPSAVGVGFLGVGLLTAVFGGLFLMDIPVFYTTIKSLFSQSSSSAAAAPPVESDC